MKARDKFIKGPLNFQMVLETELYNYNCKHGDKKPVNKKQRKTKHAKNKLHTPNQHGNKAFETNKKKISKKNCHFCGKLNWSLERICPALKALCNSCKKMELFAKVCKSKTVHWVRKENESDWSTESRPEKDHIQSVNGISQLDFSKANLLVEGQPIEFIIHTGSPVRKISSIINQKKQH